MGVGVAKRQLFVVAVLEASTPAALALVRELRDDVERMLPTNEVEAPLPWSGGSGGSGSGPADADDLAVWIADTLPREMRRCVGC